MRRVPIGFRELLLRVLPLQELSPSERQKLQDDLAKGTAREEESAALYWIEELVSRDLIRRLPDLDTGTEVLLRFQLRESLETISLRFATPSPAPGIFSIPRRLASLRATAPAAKLQALQKLDAVLLGDEQELPGSRSELLHAIEQASIELVDCDEAVFFLLDAKSERDLAYAPPLGEFSLLSEWVGKELARDDRILLCPDVASSPVLAEAGADRGIRSLLSIAVRSKPSRIHGYLELRSHQPDFFTPERQALLSLASEQFSLLLGRATRLEGLVFVDALTGAYNVNHFHPTLEGEVARARREGKSMALCIADIDDFKQFNTLYGYEGGNQVLIEVVKILQSGVRPFDSVARWGGEEFAIILAPPVGRDEAENVADRLRRAVAQNEIPVTGLDDARYRVQVTVSLGIAIYPSDADGAETLWQAANRALLAAKRPPKNRAVFFSDIANQNKPPD